MPDSLRIGFGGGCHWCTEAVFAALRGVTCVQQGFVQSTPPNDSFSEAVLVDFDPALIGLDVLSDIHLRTHASTSNHSMRSKYRSAIYVYSDTQRDQVRAVLNQLQPEFEKPLVTQVLPFVGFRASPPEFANYGAKNADGPFCTRYIDPKLDLLRRAYGTWVNDAIAVADVDS